MTGATSNKEQLPANHITGQQYCYRLENNQAITFNIVPDFNAELYRNVTLSAWIKYENVVVGPNTWNAANVFKHSLYLRNSETNRTSNASYQSLGTFSGTKDWHKVIFNVDYRQPGYNLMKTDLRFNVEGATSGTMWVAGIKVEAGDIATPWIPAFEDVLDRIAKIEQKIGM